MAAWVQHGAGVSLHGWHGLLALYALVMVPMWWGLWHRRAPTGRFLLSPVTGIAFTFVAMLVAVLFGKLAARLGSPHILQDAIALAVFPAIGYLTGRVGPRALGAQGHLRGATIEDGAEAQRLGRRNRRHAEQQGVLTLAGVPVPLEDETKHFKLLGTTGTGKSTAMRKLIAGALSRGDRAVIADPDGGYLSTFYDPERGDVILNPFDARSRKWDLFSEIRSPYDYDQLARSLIPERAGESPWPGYSRLFFAAVTRQARRIGVTDMAELYRLLTSAPMEELRILLDATPARPYVEAGNEKMFRSIHSHATTALVALDYIHPQTSELFSIRNWVQQGTGALFLPYQADQIAALRSVISTWMRIAIFETMSGEEKDHHTWFMIDELDALGPIDGLKDALARLRKFGGRCGIGLQSIAQVSGTNGHAEAQTIVENCGNTLILRCSASEGGGTARFASRLIGEREIIRDHVTRNRNDSLFAKPHRSVSHSIQHVTETAVLASEIEQLPDRTGYLKFASQPSWMKVGFPVVELPRVAKPFVPPGAPVRPAGPVRPAAS
jgi:type IV secretory pathway TraG/TraD family ATPase VirD4